MTDKMEEIVKGVVGLRLDRRRIEYIAQAIRDAGYVKASDLLTDEAVERAALGGLRFVAEAPCESVDGVALEWADADKDEQAEILALARSFIQAAIGEKT